MNDKELWELMSIICEGQDSEQRRKVEQYITDLQKEIERLNNIIKQQDTRNSRQRIANRKLLERNQDLVIENLKLNNIINELEKYINEEHIYDELGMKIFDASELQDKLQELKGSDKE